MSSVNNNHELVHFENHLQGEPLMPAAAPQAKEGRTHRPVGGLEVSTDESNVHGVLSLHVWHLPCDLEQTAFLLRASVALSANWGQTWLPHEGAVKGKQRRCVCRTPGPREVFSKRSQLPSHSPSTAILVLSLLLTSGLDVCTQV